MGGLCVWGPTIRQHAIGFDVFRLLLVCFGCWLLRLPLVLIETSQPVLLTADGSWYIERPRIAICTEMGDLVELVCGEYATILLIVVVTFGMLPGLAFLAEDATAIIMLEAAYAFDGGIVLIDLMRERGGIRVDGGFDGKRGSIKAGLSRRRKMEEVWV